SGFTALDPKSVGSVTAHDPAEGGHDRVIQPPGLLVGGEDHREGIHTARRGNHGIVGEAEQDKPQAAKPLQPSAERHIQDQLHKLLDANRRPLSSLTVVKEGTLLKTSGQVWLLEESELGDL